MSGAAPDETVILLPPPLPSAGVSTVMERERQQNDSLQGQGRGTVPVHVKPYNHRPGRHQPGGLAAQLAADLQHPVAALHPRCDRFLVLPLPLSPQPAPRTASVQRGWAERMCSRPFSRPFAAGRSRGWRDLAGDEGGRPVVLAAVLVPIHPPRTTAELWARCRCRRQRLRLTPAGAGDWRRRLEVGGLAAHPLSEHRGWHLACPPTATCPAAADVIDTRRKLWSAAAAPRARIITRSITASRLPQAASPAQKFQRAKTHCI